MDNMPLTIIDSDAGEFDLASILTKRMVEVYRKVEHKIGQYSGIREWQVKAGVTERDRAIRARLWKSILEHHAHTGTKIVLTKLLAGIMHRDSFYDALKNEERAAFIFTKPLELSVETTLMLEQSKQEIYKILDLPMMDEKGKPISSVIAAKLKIHEQLMDRKYGKAVERRQEHRMVEDVNKKSLQAPKTLQEVQSQLEALDKTEVIEVLPE